MASSYVAGITLEADTSSAEWDFALAFGMKMGIYR
jgi:hypothetical protein